jgi:ubiquinone/menaquinone biosynthesis C-methylase UbiE
MRNGSKRTIADLYRQQAQGYDASGIGALQPWREKAVKRLDLRRGDLVVDVGCGTGLNFALVQAAIGPEGRLIGVDLTDAMLAEARQRVADNNWNNVVLVQTDAAQYAFPGQVDGVLSTFALTFMPDCARVIQQGARALRPGRRWVVLDMAWPSGWPLVLRRLLFTLSSYGITADVIQRRPWQTIWEAMAQNLVDVARQRFWLGFFYLVCGRKPQ